MLVGIYTNYVACLSSYTVLPFCIRKETKKNLIFVFYFIYFVASCIR